MWRCAIAHEFLAIMKINSCEASLNLWDFALALSLKLQVERIDAHQEISIDQESNYKIN